MALTAARTELNVSLVGEDETIRMLEDAKKRMAELEAKTRSLTGATKAQAEAAAVQTSALAATNESLVGVAKKAEGVVEGVDKVRGAFEKVAGVIGFATLAVTSAIAAYQYLQTVFDDTAKETEALNKSLKAQEAALIETKKATEELAAIQQKSIEGQRSAAVSLIQEKIRLAELEKNTAAAAALRSELEQQQQSTRIKEIEEQIKVKADQQVQAANQMTEAQTRLSQFEQEVAQKRLEIERLTLDVKTQRLQIEESLTEAGEAGGSIAIATASEIQKSEARIRNLKAEINSITINTLGPERERLKVAQNTLLDILRQKSALSGLLTVAEQVAKALKKVRGEEDADKKQEEKPDAKPRFGGGGGKSRDERKKEEEEEARELAKRRRDLAQEFRLEEVEEERKHQRRLALAGLGEDNLAALRTTRDRVAAELGSLPTGAVSAAFAPLRSELEKRLMDIDGLLKKHVEMGPGEYFDQDAKDKVLAAWEAEKLAIESVDGALGKLGETRAKAIEESEKLREKLERDNLAGYVENFSGALEALNEVQAPAFEAITTSLAGVSAQMGKFKDGQQSLTSAIVGSAGAIAGAVADKVASVKVEAGIRALFETAMGFANLGNPAVAVGHFTAAAMFGAVAGGLIPAGAKAQPAGGQKAPAKPAAESRESTMGGGGGQITNVYNLNTGIVDGQSTAHAFRRAEMTARNTGMASAGGW